MTDELMDAKAVALMLGISKWSAYKLRLQMPYVRFGRTLRWKRRDVEAFIRAHYVDRSLTGSST